MSEEDDRDRREGRDAVTQATPPSTPSSPEPVSEEAPEPSSPQPAGAPSLSDLALRKYLSRPDVLVRIQARVSAKVRKADAMDVAGAAHVAILSARTRPSSEAALPAWIDTIVAREIADHTRTRKRRGRYEGDVEDIDAFADDRSIDPPVDVSITPWLEGQVEKNATDVETLGILKEKARTGATYEQIAAAHGMTEAALKKRVARFHGKYAEARRAERRRMVLWVLLVIAAGVALYALLRPLLSRSEGTIGPDVWPSAVPAPPASSVRDIAAPPTNEPSPRRDGGDPGGGKPKVK
jgi:DNA-directed RNA polymerase specialized sigma24 family protein